MKIFVIGLTGKRLMPTTSRKARILLESSRAEIACRVPFRIKLLYKTGGSTQPLAIGVDTGEQHIDIAVASGQTILHKVDIELRKSMEKQKLMVTRQEYRRGPPLQGNPVLASEV